MSAPKMRRSPNTGGVADGVSDVQVVFNEQNNFEGPSCPVVTNEQAQACASFKAGHNVHWIQFKLAVGSPIFQVEILSVSGQSFLVKKGEAVITYYTHRPEQIQALIDHYGVGVCGWVHDKGLFESQGHFLYVATEEAEFVPCSLRSEK